MIQKELMLLPTMIQENDELWYRGDYRLVSDTKWNEDMPTIKIILSLWGPIRIQKGIKVLVRRTFK